MKKLEFFMNAVNAGNLKKKSWIFRAFSLTLPHSENTIPWDIKYSYKGEDKTRLHCTFTDGDNNLIELDDYELTAKDQSPPFTFAEKVKIKVGDLENLKEDITTAYGNILANWLWLVYPFGDRIPYIQGKFRLGDIEAIIEPILTTIPKDLEAKRDPKYIYVDEYIKFTRVKGIIDGISQLCVPSATEKTLGHHPDRDKVRAELIKKYEGRLKDPAVAALIDKRMVELDKEWLKGDESEGFYSGAKALEISRKKAHGLMGLEQAFNDVGEDTTYIDTALSDGWNRQHMAAIVNNSREGSFDRGFQTALGGKATKDILKILQNSVLTIDDCGAKIGIDVLLTDKDYNEYINNTLIVDGKLVRLTKENFSKFTGTRQVMRTAGYCKASAPNFCKICIGGKYENHPTGLGTAGASMTTKFMLIFMKSAHGKALKTVDYDFESELT
jgi:hypothetical protein